MLQNSGKIYAFDIDAKRLDLLKRLHRNAGVTCVETRLQSFLDSDPTDEAYANVEYVLCDPSCSGSGMTNTLLHDIYTSKASVFAPTPTYDKDTKKRKRGKALPPSASVLAADAAKAKIKQLEGLAKFQLDCVTHAMDFPAVHSVSYSTCSIHEVSCSFCSFLFAVLPYPRCNQPCPFVCVS